MNKPKAELQKRIESGKPLLLAEISVAAQADADQVRQLAARYAGKVHAVGVSDNRDRVGMAALAAAALVCRPKAWSRFCTSSPAIATAWPWSPRSWGPGPWACGTCLCTSGTHQTLGQFRAAKNVFDVDVGATAANLRQPGRRRRAGGRGGPRRRPDRFCLGGVASPDADPLELQVMRLGKKAAAGAGFLITQPVYDLERFDAWWAEVTRRGLHEKVAIVAGIQPLGEAEQAAELAAKRPRPRIPAAVLPAVASQADRRGPACRAAIAMAVETIERLSDRQGPAGFPVCVRRRSRCRAGNHRKIRDWGSN